MKKTTWLLLPLLASAASVSLVSQPAAANSAEDQLDAAGLKAMIEGLGYETSTINKEVGKEKLEFKVTTKSVNVPIGAEISASKNYVWLTVFLGASKPTLKFEELLKKNGELQPSFFYITAKGNLMIAEALDNRSLNAAAMKRCVDKLAADVDATQSLWGSQ